MKLYEVCNFLDEYLQIKNYQDVSNNGLQVEGKSEVEKIAFAVDACMESFRAAKANRADMLVVHHGLIWGGIGYVRGIVRRRIEYLLRNNISLYAAHLPLDAHREIGNNAVLLKKIGAKAEKEFGEYRGVKIGYSAELPSPMSVVEVAEKLGAGKLGGSLILPFGSDKVRRVAAVSGKGSFAVNEAVEEGIELLITGEAEHEAYHIAREGGLNIIFLGHYESERVGVESLMKVVAEKLGIESIFIDIPTNL